MSEPSKFLSSKELADLIEQLDLVMEEAANLRRQVTRQLSDQRHHQQQRLSPVVRTAARKQR